VTISKVVEKLEWAKNRFGDLTVRVPDHYCADYDVEDVTVDEFFVVSNQDSERFACLQTTVVTKSTTKWKFVE